MFFSDAANGCSMLLEQDALSHAFCEHAHKTEKFSSYEEHFMKNVQQKDV